MARLTGERKERVMNKCIFGSSDSRTFYNPAASTQRVASVAVVVVG